MTWDRWELGQNAIFYDENIRPSHPPAALYPPQVEALRRSMLDFSCLILNHTVGPRGVQVHPTGGEGESQKTDPALTAARKTLHEVSRIHHGGYSEDTWASFFKDSFFKPLAGRLRPEEDSRRHVRSDRVKSPTADIHYAGFRAVITTTMHLQRKVLALRRQFNASWLIYIQRSQQIMGTIRQ